MVIATRDNQPDPLYTPWIPAVHLIACSRPGRLTAEKMENIKYNADIKHYVNIKYDDCVDQE